MSQTITFTNPTGEPVAYQSRECRLTVPASDSVTKVLKDEVATRVLADFKRHHPLISTSVAEPEEPEAEPEQAPAKPKGRPTRKANQSAPAADGSEEAAK